MMEIQELNEKHEELKKILKGFTEDDFRLVKQANDIIKTINHYGVHEITVPSDSIELDWSNGGRSWYACNGVIKKGTVVKIDANEFLLPTKNFEQVKKIAPFLIELPLYFASMEAKMRGEISPIDAMMLWIDGNCGGLPYELLEHLDKQYKFKDVF